MSEYHHHHHHHNDRGRTILTIVIVVVVLTALVVLGTIFIPKLKSGGDVTNQDSITLHVSKNNLIITLGSTADVYVKYGHNDELSENSFADFTKTKVKRTEYECKYNGEYTVTARFKSGVVKTEYITVKSNKEPITINVVGDKMNIERNSGFSIQSLEYCYGERLGDPYADYLPIDKDDMQAQAFGNGWHTFRVFAISDEGSGSYYVATNVTTCTEPIVMFYKEAIGVFSYGFDVTDIIYSKGSFSDWNSLSRSSDAVNAVPNCMISIEDFESGLYTFGFRSSEKQYFITVNVVK